MEEGGDISMVHKWILRHRWILVLFLLLPLSTLYDTLLYVRTKLMFKLFTSPKLHDQRVKRVQKQVQKWLTTGSLTPMCTGRPGWQTMSIRPMTYKKSMYNIDINLKDILKVDPRNEVVTVEPLVTIGQLMSVLLPMGWTLPVVPELEDLTIGGLIMGCGIETSSHKYGLFQHICEAYELVLADGSLKRCTRLENEDLFYSVPWSHGTLGFLVSADIKIVPAKKYVRVKYTPAYSRRDMIDKLARESNNLQNDFVEGLAFDSDSGVIMTGKMTDECVSGQVNAIGKWHKPWFFTHVKSYLQNKKTDYEYIPLKDYYHRHSRSIFWEIQDILSFGNNMIFRWLCGWMIPPKISFLKLTQTKAITKYYEKFHVIQDVLVPLKYLPDTLEIVHDKLHMYPIWLCPFRLPSDPGMVHPAKDEAEMYVDVGLYGIPKEPTYKPGKTLTEIETFSRQVNGFHMLYADCFQTREDFDEMFDRSLYNYIRHSLGCKSAFPDIYEKIKR